MTEVYEALRHWAKGLYPLEAGVGLLIHAFDGRFATSVVRRPLRTRRAMSAQRPTMFATRTSSAEPSGTGNCALGEISPAVSFK